jgi:nucleolar protein 56
MRLREWFSWHFPELSKIVTDNHIFTKIVHKIENRDNANDESKEELSEILHDEEKAQ